MIDLRHLKKNSRLIFLLSFNYHLMNKIIFHQDFLTYACYFQTHPVNYHLFPLKVIIDCQICLVKNVIISCHILVHHISCDNSFHLLVIFINAREDKHLMTLRGSSSSGHPCDLSLSIDFLSFALSPQENVIVRGTSVNHLHLIIRVIVKFSFYDSSSLHLRKIRQVWRICRRLKSQKTWRMSTSTTTTMRIITPWTPPIRPSTF